MDTGRRDAVTGLGMPAYSTGWTARRLGVAAATLRTWHRRYGAGPTGRTVGGHRRYVPRDLDRLERMRRLMLAGLSTAEAARVSVDASSGPPAAAFALDRRGGEQSGAPKWASTWIRHLMNAAMALGQPVLEPLLNDALQERGVVATWTESLHALGAASAEIGCPSRILGASVPTDDLVGAVRRLAPRAVFIWAQTAANARVADLNALPRRRPPTPIVVGGPGWRSRTTPSSVVRVNTLAEAVAAVTHDFMTSTS